MGATIVNRIEVSAVNLRNAYGLCHFEGRIPVHAERDAAQSRAKPTDFRGD